MSPALSLLYGACVPLESAEWVRELRERNDLTQEQFAERISSDRVTVARWEGGRYAPDFPSIQKILASFPEAAALLAGETVKQAPAPRLKSLEAREIAHVVDRQPLKMRGYLRDMVYRVIGEAKGRPRTT